MRVFPGRVVATLYPAGRHTDRKSSYPHYSTVLNLTGIKFLMTLKDIPKIERLNAVYRHIWYIENE